MFLPDGAASVWYVDIIDSLEYDDDGVAVFIDKYLDVIFTPQGDVIIDDRDELDDAFGRGELSEKQHKEALRECDSIIDELCSDVAATGRLHSEILRHVTERAKNGEESPIQKETNYGNVR